MVALRLRYENGHFTPLDPLPSLEEGQEIVVQWQAQTIEITAEAQLTALEQTAGTWGEAEVAQLEHYIQESRQLWDEEWQQRLNSL